MKIDNILLNSKVLKFRQNKTATYSKKSQMNEYDIHKGRGTSKCFQDSRLPNELKTATKYMY